MTQKDHQHIVWHKAVGASLFLLCIVGCGESGPETIPVRGNVQFAGREWPHTVRVFFQTSGDGARPSSVEVRSDGNFTINTLPGRVGLMPGNYKVLVEYYDLKPGGNAAIETDFLLGEFYADPLELKTGQDPVELKINVPRAK